MHKMKILIAILIFFILSGCANARYRDGDKEISYSAWFKELNDLDVDINTGKIKLGGSKNNTDDLVKAFKLLGLIP